MSTCNNGIDIPILLTEECDGVYTSDQCIRHADAISYLSLPADSSLAVIVTNLVLALMYKDEQIAELTTRIEILENL